MLKGLLSDFNEIIQTSYQSTSPQPYISMTLTIISFTILVYSFQIFSTNIHTYAQNPVAFQNRTLQTKNCNVFPANSMKSFCRKLTDNNGGNYKSEELLSFEQDLQSSKK